jgi:predicted O-methyltransferase YrrM
MMNERERLEIARLWQRKLDQDANALPQSDRHRNLEPDSADFIHTLASGLKARNLLEIGGSSGLSTIALASAARQTKGKLTSIEIEPQRQHESRTTIEQLGLSAFVNFVLGDAASILPSLDPMDFILIDCEKDDYIRFFDMLKLEPGAIVVADNILSHSLTDYVSHVRSRRLESITLPVGKGLELSRVVQSKSGTQ